MRPLSEANICTQDQPHAPHDIPVTLNYSCSGSIECQGEWGKPHEDHRLTKQITLSCPGDLRGIRHHG